MLLTRRSKGRAAAAAPLASVGAGGGEIRWPITTLSANTSVRMIPTGLVREGDVEIPLPLFHVVVVVVP